MCELLDNVLLFKARPFIQKERSIAFYLLIDRFTEKNIYVQQMTPVWREGWHTSDGKNASSSLNERGAEVTKMLCHWVYHASIFNLQNPDPIDNNESDQSA